MMASLHEDARSGGLDRAFASMNRYQTDFSKSVLILADAVSWRASPSSGISSAASWG